MMRFMLAVFALLFAGFWHLSGGASFEPEAAGPVAASAAAPPAASATRARAAEPVRISFDPAAREVATEAGAAQDGPEPAVTPAPPAPPAPPATIRWDSAADAVAAALGPGAPAASPSPDRVRVAGTRVNMRQGPGMTYGVLETLPGGTLAERLETVDGWARIRLNGTGRIGWMSENLLDEL